jgi:hypothetical protein
VADRWRNYESCNALATNAVGSVELAVQSAMLG